MYWAGQFLVVETVLCSVFVSIPDPHTLDATSSSPSSECADTINQVWWCAPVPPALGDV